MFQRGQSLRLLFGNSHRNGTSTSGMGHKKLARNNKKSNKNKKSSRDSFRQIMRDRRKYRSRLEHCMAVLGICWNAPTTSTEHAKAKISNINKKKKKKDGSYCYKISTPDDRFHLVVSVPKPIPGASGTPCLSISTCIYTCTSHVQSRAVMEKARKMNHQPRKGYTLTINPGSFSPSSPHHHHDKEANSMVTSQQQLRFEPLPIKINLCVSRPIADLFNTGSNGRNDSTNSGDGAGGDDEFFAAIKDFVKVAIRVQTQLESVDEGRLGMAPMPTSTPHDTVTTSSSSSSSSSTTSNMPHVEFLANPPSILAKFISLTATVVVHPKKNHRPRKEECLISAAIPSRGRSLTRKTSAAARTKTRTPSRSSNEERIQKSFRSNRTRRRRRSSTSTKNILSQFSSPEEARVFELYAKIKSKRRNALKKPKTAQKYLARSTKLVDTTDAAATSSGNDRSPPRLANVPAGNRTLTATIIPTNGPLLFSPKPPSLLLSDRNKTPVISNKGHIIMGIGLKNKKLFEKTSSCSSSNSNIGEEETSLSFETTKKASGMEFRDFSRNIVSERNLLNGDSKVGGSTRILI